MKKIFKNKKVDAGVTSSKGLDTFLILLFSSMLLISGVGVSVVSSSLSTVPYPIYGTSTWEGDGNAVGADVRVHCCFGDLYDTVDTGGEWQVDCGDPGADWPHGTGFMVSITGSGSHEGWSGQRSGIVNLSMGAMNMGNIVVYPNKNPYSPNEPSGPKMLGVGKTALFNVSATDPNWEDKVQYRFDWDDGTISDWTNLVNNGEYAHRSHSWDTATGFYSLKAQTRDEHGAMSEWSEKPYYLVLVDDPPDTPSTPSGPKSGFTGFSYTYSTSSTDSNGDKIIYGWDWNGDDIVDEWTTGFYESGTTVSISHTWDTAGLYGVKVIAKDSWARSSSFSSAIYVHITPDDNHPPNKPSKPSGPASCKAGSTYEYSSSTTDPDDDQVFYLFDWGDGSTSAWLGPFSSGATTTASHSWASQGSYQVKVKARDSNNVESAWSDPLPISVPKGRQLIMPFLSQFLDRLDDRFLRFVIRLPQIQVIYSMFNQI